MDARPSIDVIVATRGRSEELVSLLGSLVRQEPTPARVIVVDQNDDDRVAGVLAAAGGGLELVHLRCAPGLSRARNAGLAVATADLVSFPDDDCAYPHGLLGQVVDWFATDRGLGALTGRTADPSGKASTRWATAPGPVSLEHVWHAGNSASTFVRREAITRAGSFDERLGLGSGTPWSSGEDIDLLIRLLRAGERVEYDPSIVVEHPLRAFTPAELAGIGGRDGASVGFLLRKHHYGPRVVTRMLVRPGIGIAAALVQRDRTTARFRAATLRGRLRGYRAGRPADEQR